MSLPTVSIATARTGASSRTNEFGMREMQERVYARRGERYLLLKSPPASGKSRALMFLALDKLTNQGVKQAIVVVPERSIGGSFGDEALTQHGFFADWTVRPRWNLCEAPGTDEGEGGRSKVRALGEFLQSEDRALVCTHATFRLAMDELGVEAFDDRLIAVDEFHHVSADPENRLGAHVTMLIERKRAHIVAMTGSYFRGDAVPVLRSEDEAVFATVTYTYHEQLNGYEYLKSLAIGYSFYTGPYLDSLPKVLDPELKTIVHIPSVNARESLKDKLRELGKVYDYLGEWQGRDPATGFDLIRRPDGRILRAADLVDDTDAGRRTKVLSALRDPTKKHDRDHVDVIVALGMAKEGFDWIWCEHALTIGYRSSLTEIVQIIGRATRDAPGKEVARFTNLIAEPDASEDAVVGAVNDTLKAIAASLLMEQVLAPRFEFTAKGAGPQVGFDYGEGGYQPGGTNIGVNDATGRVHVEIKGLVEPRSDEAKRICAEDINEVVAAIVQDKTAVERGLFDHETTIPEEITQARVGKIVRERYPELSDGDVEAVRQQAIAAFTLVQHARTYNADEEPEGDPDDRKPGVNTSLLQGIRRFAMDVQELDIDLIDRVNPFDAAYAILARSLDERTLKQVQASIAAKRVAIPREEAEIRARRAAQFKRERNRMPEITATDPFERYLAEGVAAYTRYRQQEARIAAPAPGIGEDTAS